MKINLLNLQKRNIKGMKNIRTLIGGLIILLASGGINSLNAEGAVRYSSDSDTIKIRQLIEAASGEDNHGKKIVAAARVMKGLPQAPAADNDFEGTIVIRMDSVSQKEFLNLALAAAKASYAYNAGILEFEKALEDVSRKKGVDEGFSSQFHYGSDWIVDNVYRGNVKEMTDLFNGGNFRTKTLDYVSHHKDQYPALADSTMLDKIKIVEMGYRSHRIPHQKKQSINNKSLLSAFEDGDIIMMLAPDHDFDVYDLGIVTIKDGQPYLIHISRQTGVVEEDDYPLPRLFKIEGQHFYGYRWLRPTE